MLVCIDQTDNEDPTKSPYKFQIGIIMTWSLICLSKGPQISMQNKVCSKLFWFDLFD